MSDDKPTVSDIFLGTNRYHTGFEEFWTEFEKSLRVRTYNPEVHLLIINEYLQKKYINRDYVFLFDFLQSALLMYSRIPNMKKHIITLKENMAHKFIIVLTQQWGIARVMTDVPIPNPLCPHDVECIESLFAFCIPNNNNTVHNILYVAALREMFFHKCHIETWQKVKNFITIVYKLGYSNLITSTDVGDLLKHFMKEAKGDTKNYVLFYILILFYKHPYIIVKSEWCEHFYKNDTEYCCFEYFDLGDGFIYLLLSMISESSLDVRYFQKLMEYFFYDKDKGSLWKRAVLAGNLQLLDFAWKHFEDDDCPCNIMRKLDKSPENTIISALAIGNLSIIEFLFRHMCRHIIQESIDPLVEAVVVKEEYKDVLIPHMRRLGLLPWFTDSYTARVTPTVHQNLLAHLQDTWDDGEMSPE